MKALAGKMASRDGAVRVFTEVTFRQLDNPDDYGSCDSIPLNYKLHLQTQKRLYTSCAKNVHGRVPAWS
jgi:hypothetical protein